MNTITNKNEFLEAVKNDGWALYHASKELRDDKQLILEAIKYDAYTSLVFASERLRNDKEVVLEAVKENGHALYCASDELKDNEEIVLEAIKNDDFVLWFASSRLRNIYKNNLKI